MGDHANVFRGKIQHFAANGKKLYFNVEVSINFNVEVKVKLQKSKVPE